MKTLENLTFATMGKITIISSRATTRKIKNRESKLQTIKCYISHYPFSDTETCRKRLKKKRKSRSKVHQGLHTKKKRFINDESSEF